MNKFKLLVSNTLIFAIGTVLTKLILFLLMPLYTSVLTTEQFGYAEILNNSVELLLPIATLCIADAVFRFAIDDDSNKTNLLSTGINLLIKGFILILILIFILDCFYEFDYSFYLVLLYVSTAIKQLFAQFCRGIGHVKIFTISGVLGALSLLVSNLILLVIFKLEVPGYLSAIIISNIISAVYLFIVSDLHKYISMKSVDKGLLKSMLLFSIPNVANMVSWWVNNTSSRYIILGYYGAGAAGMFTAASKLPAMINLLSSIFQQAWQYSSSKEIKNEDSGDFFTDVYKYFSSFIFISSALLLIVTPVISKFLLQGEFYSAWVFVPLLLVSAVLGSFSIFFGTFYMAVKKNTMAMISTVIGAITNLITCLLLVPIIGVYGALVASVVSYLFVVIFRIVNTRQYANVNINLSKLIINLMVILFQAVILTINSRFSLLLALIMLITILIVNAKDFYGFFKIVTDRKKRE
ncbi:lipopolysaccharide biosynthesis protein [Paenibacillus terrigena]|uniref:lipopolysaccharide biosynthesis protein n=1 Tax=Paenibacillus terrigena TaxID=369333 RepID=UPI00036AD220|nr:oligosaccharide flippase family protein [Paenibacillus terrigena]